jgi:serine/threonine protein kinase, bacterial
MPLRVGESFAGYRILRQLGSGGMGEVYLVQHPRLPRKEALKVLRPDISGDPAFRDRFVREADLAAGLRHPHIVGIHDRGEHDGQLWISMDYIDGTDLGHLVEHRYPAGMPIDLVVPVVNAVASALDYAHKKGLLHRDVKPANIMVADLGTDDASIHLADFGIARPLDDTDGLTTTNMTVGTVAYAAPEQLMGEAIDGRADEYALAATTYHMLTGAQLFPHSNPAVVITHHLNAEPPQLSNVKPEHARLDPVLAIALAKVPKDRFPRCLDFGRALQQAKLANKADPHAARTMLAAVGASTDSHTRRDVDNDNSSLRPPPLAGANPARKRWLYAASALGMALLLTGLLITWRPWRTTDPGIGNSTPSASASSSSRSPVPPPDQTGEQPHTLEAATLALQESSDRMFAGEFAEVWELYFAKLRERITQADFVTYMKACKEHDLPIKATGVRMDGPDTALVRESILDVGVIKTMVYEDGRWKLETTDESWLEDLGLPVDQLIAKEKAAGKCDKEPEP